MRLGLVGTGKQGQRYLLEKNGAARNIVSTFDRHADSLLDWLWRERIDAVIIASHPASHAELALKCLEYRKPLLIEKPLALNLADCEAVLDEAQRVATPVEVAHTHLWSEKWRALPIGHLVKYAEGHLVYTDTGHDYSPWLDWGPHMLALLEDVGAANTETNFRKGDARELGVSWLVGEKKYSYDGDCSGEHTPMWHMMKHFRKLVHAPGSYKVPQRIAANRRVYRALFSEE